MNRAAVLAALASAALFGVSTPAAKALLGVVHPVILAGLFYCGAGIGIALLRAFAAPVLNAPAARQQPLARQDYGWLAGAIAFGGIAGPVLLMLGLARTGSCMAPGSGEIVIAFSTAYRIPHAPGLFEPPVALVSNDGVSGLFSAVVEATEEAVYNSLLQAAIVAGRDGHTVERLPVYAAIEICRRHGVLDVRKEAQR